MQNKDSDISVLLSWITEGEHAQRREVATKSPNNGHYCAWKMDYILESFPKGMEKENIYSYEKRSPLSDA